jgi:hypothetical protein
LSSGMCFTSKSTPKMEIREGSVMQTILTLENLKN